MLKFENDYSRSGTYGVKEKKSACHLEATIYKHTEIKLQAEVNAIRETSTGDGGRM